MTSRSLAPLLVLLISFVLVSCSHSFKLREPLVATPNGFSYRSDCPGACDLSSPDAEEVRLSNLRAQLANARMCPNGYLIENRSAHGVTIHSPATIVIYEGRCR
jgi:hypothetical protein